MRPVWFMNGSKERGVGFQREQQIWELVQVTNKRLVADESHDAEGGATQLFNLIWREKSRLTLAQSHVDRAP